MTTEKASDSESLIDIQALLEDHSRVISSLKGLTPTIQQIAVKLTACLKNGGKVLWMGNGGSAADAQHLAAELVVRFTRERRAFAAIALTTDTSILTAAANDYSFEQIFARQINGLCVPGDAVVGISTSGNSPNVLAGIDAANRIGAFTVALTGNNGGKMMDKANICLDVPSSVTARIQEAHVLIGHILCDWIEATLLENGNHV